MIGIDVQDALVTLLGTLEVLHVFVQQPRLSSVPTWAGNLTGSSLVQLASILVVAVAIVLQAPSRTVLRRASRRLPRPVPGKRQLPRNCHPRRKPWRNVDTGTRPSAPPHRRGHRATLQRFLHLPVVAQRFGLGQGNVVARCNRLARPNRKRSMCLGVVIRAPIGPCPGRSA